MWAGGAGDRTYRRIAGVHERKRCSICRKEGKLEVHHINGNRRDNRKANLMVVCTVCHRKEHRFGDRLPKLAPGKWAFEWDRCRHCHRTDRKHRGHGLCRTCYMAERRAGRL